VCVSQLGQRLTLQLAHSLAAEAEAASDLFPRPLVVIVESESKLEHSSLTRLEGLQRRSQLASSL
jgi:hypothetical protein